MHRIWTGCLLALLIPYVVTLVWTGTIRGEERQAQMISGKNILLEQGGSMDVEEYLIGIVGRQMPADYGKEALKAQAIVARTYIYKKMDGEGEMTEAALHMDYLKETQLKKLWGSDKYVTYYRNIEEAVNETQGIVMTYEGEKIDALFHRASAGATRTGDEHHPYLRSVESPRDVEAEGCLTMSVWEPEDFAGKISGIKEGGEVNAGQLPESIQLIEKDDAGYVGSIQIGNHTYTGEEVQEALALPSCCFTMEDYEGKIRVISKGIGHGFGLSQYGAGVMAEEGSRAEDILTYYFKNIDLISE